jgi:hypothetical protein
MRNPGRRRELGQSTVEWGGALLVVALIIAAVAAFGIPRQVAHGIECTVEKALGEQSQGCASSSATPYEVACRISTSTNSAQLDVKIAFVRVSDNDTLVKMTYSDGSSSFILTHMGSAQAEAAIGAEFQAGGFGGSAMASAAAGGQLAGAQEWDFTTRDQAAKFEKQIQGHGGWNTIAHDLVNGVLPPGVSNVAGWGLNLIGVHDDSGLPKPTQTYVKVGAVGGLQAGVNAGIGGASAALDAKLKAALGARLTTSGPNKGQAQVYLQLDGSGTASLQNELFGPGSIKGGANAGAVGQAVATVTISPSGQPLNVTITAWGGYTLGAAGGQGVSGADAQAIQQALKKASLKLSSGSGNGVQWTGTIDLTKHPGDIEDVLSALDGSSGGIPQLVHDFDQDGSQQLQPFALNRSEGGAGVEGDVGVGLGAEGNSTDTTQNYTPGLVKPPGAAWGPMVCIR